MKGTNHYTACQSYQDPKGCICALVKNHPEVDWKPAGKIEDIKAPCPYGVSKSFIDSQLKDFIASEIAAAREEGYNKAKADAKEAIKTNRYWDGVMREYVMIESETLQAIENLKNDKLQKEQK